MISLSKNFLFVHKPKTGGNSLQNILAQYSEDVIFANGSHQDGLERFEVRGQFGGLKKHSTLDDYYKTVDRAIYDKLFKFSIIRNPWDLMISWYFSPHMGFHEFERDRFIRMIGKTKTLRHFICVASPLGLKRGKLGHHLDALLRFERLDEDFGQVCTQLGIPVQPLPRRNASTREPYHCYYDRKLRDLVARRFKEEIAFGQYSFE